MTLHEYRECRVLTRYGALCKCALRLGWRLGRQEPRQTIPAPRWIQLIAAGSSNSASSTSSPLFISSSSRPGLKSRRRRWSADRVALRQVAGRSNRQALSICASLVALAIGAVTPGCAASQAGAICASVAPVSSATSSVAAGTALPLPLEQIAHPPAAHAFCGESSARAVFSSQEAQAEVQNRAPRRYRGRRCQSCGSPGRHFVAADQVIFGLRHGG